jgi:ABC-type branched-subunit amino acid transport system substrate-binding protein
MARAGPRLAVERAVAAWHALAQAASACLAAALLAACTGTSHPPELATGPLQPALVPAAAAPRPVKVGLIVPLSAAGQPGLIGNALQHAGELALFERDNPNVQLLVKDDRGTPEGARAAAQEVLRDGARLLLGPLFAKSVMAVAPLAREAGVAVVAFSNDRQVAGNGVYLLGFQPLPEIDRIVGFAAAQGKRRYAALIPKGALGKIAEASLRAAVGRIQGSIVASEIYPPSANGVLDPLRRISDAIASAEDGGAPVDALFLPGGQEDVELIARLLPQAEIDTQKVKVLGTGGMDYPHAGREAKLVGAWYAAPDPSGWAAFAQAYAKSFGEAPPRIASLAYDAVSLVAALAADADATRFSAAALTRTSGFAGAEGSFRLHPDGTSERALAILEVGPFEATVIDAPLAPGGDTHPTAAAKPTRAVN